MPSYLARFEDTARIFDYVGTWRAGSLAQDPQGNQYSQGTFTLTNTKSSTFSFSFYGTEVSIFGAKRGNHGRYQVTMDGVASPEATGQAEPGRFNETLFTRTTTLGWHNVTMINLEDLYLDIDSVSWLAKVGNDDEELTTETKEDTDSSFVWIPDGAWSTAVPPVTALSQSSGHSSSTPGASAQLMFEGDAIALYGPIGPRGAAQYSVTVGCRPPSYHTAWAASNVPQSQLLYYGANLGGGRHTLTLKLESITDSSQFLAVDYAEIYSAPSIQNSQPSGDDNCGASGGSRSSEQSTPIGLIVGVAVAGFIALLAIALLGYLYYLYRQNRLNFAGRRAPSPPPQMSLTHPAAGGYHTTPYVPPSADQYSTGYPAQTPTTMGMSVPAMGYYNSSDSYHRAMSPEATSSSDPSQSGVFVRPRSIHKGQRGGNDGGTANVVPPPTYTMQ